MSTRSPIQGTNDELTMRDVVDLAANDNEFYSRFWFPKTVRQASPTFHRDIWDALENPLNRLVNIQVFRGGAKTTLLRMFTSKRIAYGISRTILYIGKSEGHAARSVRWLMNQIEHNKQWAAVYGLGKGSKWTDTECMIHQQLPGMTEPTKIWILAMGITGSVRGINMDDYRPDLIVVDDVIDEENSATLEQRKKIEELIYGALKESLSPASETPEATMAMLQTPLHKEDASTKALDDPEWVSFVYGKLDEHGESRWPERWSTEVIERDRQSAISRNNLSVWNREILCKLTSPETNAFRPEWVNFWDIEPQGGVTCLAIDPVPPPTEIQVAKALEKKDFESFAVVRKFNNAFYILEMSSNRGHDPEWTISEFFRLLIKYHPRLIVAEAYAYQAALVWLLKKAMKERGQYAVIEAFKDTTRNKFTRIVDALAGPGSMGDIYFHESQHSLISQFIDYPRVAHDDELDAVAMAVARLRGQNEMLISEMTEAQLDGGSLLEDSTTVDRYTGKTIVDDSDWRGAP
jgi:predicted phage terminase large subunit-like protein